jgi:membrane protease YdiL (CAAX protease family)
MPRWPLPASTAAALAWAALVAHAPPHFYPAAAALCALWLPLSAAAAPPGLAERLRPIPADLALGALSGLLLFLATRAFLWLFCGPLSSSLCAPAADLFSRFRPEGLARAALLGLVAAPAEELFWRGVVQARLARRLGEERGLVVATLAAAGVALASGEPLLALATLPTFALWGALAAWRRSLVPALVSHATWTLLVATLLGPR